MGAFLLGLASLFIKALVSSAGSALGQKAVEIAVTRFQVAGEPELAAVGVPRTPTEQVRAQRIVVEGLDQDEQFRREVHETVRAMVPAADAAIESAANEFRREPELATKVIRGEVNLFDLEWLRDVDRRSHGFSELHLAYLHGPPGGGADEWSQRCPVGGEQVTFLTGVTYRDGDGKEAHPHTFKDYMNMRGQMITKSSVVATCENGHTWRVFAS
jgi:hypothetical protein